MVSYFYENGVTFNTAAPSSFALMIGESMKFARQYPLQIYNVPDQQKFSSCVITCMTVKQEVLHPLRPS